MKKVVLIVIVAALLSIGAAGAFAAVNTRAESVADTAGDGVCDIGGGVDADGDGVCDNCPNDGVRPQDGTGRQARQRAAEKAGFADADGDGVCDNRPNGGIQPRNGTGAQRGRGGRNN
ncbi:MAG: hypothetical protein ACOX17_01495 [Christensenellales bacterium]|jgi:hypothetical protein